MGEINFSKRGTNRKKTVLGRIYPNPKLKNNNNDLLKYLMSEISFKMKLTFNVYILYLIHSPRNSRPER